MEAKDLRYPVGKFNRPTEFNRSLFESWIPVIKSFPSNLRSEVVDLSPEQLQWKYRPDGWNIAQVVHHCADSHMNSFIRFKLALTEDRPTIKPYMEALWAELPDGKSTPIETSLSILDGLHIRWTVLLENLSDEDLVREFRHPDWEKPFRIGNFLALYEWHCRHHLGHVLQAKESAGKYN